MREEMSRKEDTGKVGLKRSRHHIETAGAQCRHSRRLVRGKSCQGISCCHKSSCHLSAEIDLPAFCYSAFTHPEFFLPSHNATETFLCVDSCCRHKQVTMAPVWDHEVSAVTGRGRRGLVAQQGERTAALQWRTSWSAGRRAQLHLSVTCLTCWEVC